MTGDDRRRFRRAVSLLLMTLGAPGSAQLVAGNRTVGKLALRIALGVAAFALLVGLLALFASGVVVSILTVPAVLAVLQVLFVCLGLGWLALFADAWRLGRPLSLHHRHRRIAAVVAGGLGLAVVATLLTSSYYVAVTRDSINEIFAATKVSNPDAGRYNVLLMGADAGEDRVGLRPDSLTLASIDEKTGETAMFGFPRNLYNVPFPPGSPMHETFPDGFDCGDECLLNAVYTWAEAHPSRFPGDERPGVTATKDAISAISGLQVDYYVLIDMQGFEKLIDALGGVVIDNQRSLPVGPPGRETQEIPAGRQRMDGFTALWYARSRSDSSDYDRMARQRCVMSAMLQQFDPANVAVRFSDIAKAGQQVVSTDLPASEIDTFVDLALKAKRQSIETVQFVPPLIDAVHPDYDLIQGKVRQVVHPAPAKQQAQQAQQTQPSRSAQPTRPAGEPDAGSSGGAERAGQPEPDPDAGPEPKGVDELRSVCGTG